MWRLCVRINKVQQNLFPHGPFYVYIVNLNVIENNCQEMKSSDEAGPFQFNDIKLSKVHRNQKLHNIFRNSPEMILRLEKSTNNFRSFTATGEFS
jgi:hypothetical protein